MAKRPLLVGEYFSPWTEKARWALDHHAIAHDYSEHVPLIGEPLLRLRARSLTGRVSVPLLITESGPLPDSLAIAQYAEKTGVGEPLFPEAQRGAIREWNERSERAISAARVSYLDRVSKSRDAKLEMQPAVFPDFVRRASLPAADLAIAFLRRKYGVDGEAQRAAEGAWTTELDALRSALAGRPYLLDRFSYADIAMALGLQFLAPVADTYLPLGPATRASCRHEALADAYADLVAWRDTLYERHRRQPKRWEG
jgi:glutathione S-transferase